jgi:8-oxo-dGTP diphosphatase
VRIVHVAVGVILNKDGQVLIAKRPDDAHQGGLWEFPGGKVEQGEALFDALKRELHEELAIQIIASESLIKITHDYGDKKVCLDVHKVTEFSGEPQGNEGQPIRWVRAQDLFQYDFPAANRPIVTAINLPQTMLITGEAANESELLAKTERALQSGIRLAQLRVHPENFSAHIVQEFAILCRRYSARAQLNTSPEIFSGLPVVGMNLGLHLNSRFLMTLQERPVASSILLSASCHNEIEIAQAHEIGVDFICLSPVLATNSHPGESGMGWDKFAELVEVAKLPTYALGGMGKHHLKMAMQHGAQGIAAISEWWGD